MKKNLSFVMSGLLMTAAGMQTIPAKADEIIEARKIALGVVAASVVYGGANLGAQKVISKVINSESFTGGFYKGSLFKLCSYGCSSTMKFNETSKALVRPCVLAALLVCTIPAARWGTCPKLGMQDLAMPLALGVGGLLVAETFVGYVSYRKAPDTFAGDVRKYTTAGKYAGYVATIGGITLGAGITGYTLLQRYK